MDLSKVHAWLRAKYQSEAGTERDVVVRMRQKAFHRFLAENDMDVAEVVYECQEQGWIRCVLFGQDLDLKARHYGLTPYYDIQPKVLEISETPNDSVHHQRFAFEKRWKAEYPKARAVKMRMAYVEQYPDDANVDARSFQNARQWAKRQATNRPTTPTNPKKTRSAKRGK